MKGTLFTADFIKDSSDNLRLLELNTDTAFTSGALQHVDFNSLFTVLSENSIDTLEIVYKQMHNDFVEHLSSSIQNQSNITSFVKHLEDTTTIYPTSIDDSDNKFILRLAYDESAIFDSTYCKSSISLHDLFLSNNTTGSVPNIYISSSDFLYNTINNQINSPAVPDLVVKKEDVVNQPLEFYKLEIPEGSDIGTVFSDFISTKSNSDNIIMNYIDNEDPYHKSVRSFNILYVFKFN